MLSQMKLIISAALVLLSSPSVEAGDNTHTETRPITGECRGVVLNSNADVIIRQGDKASVTLSGPAEEVANTETVVEKNRLVIRRKDEHKRWDGKSQKGVTVTVVIPVVEAISLNGSGDLRSEGRLTGPELTVSLAGSGDVRITADVSGSLTTSVIGSGDVHLVGRCATHSIRIAGSGDIHADQMAAGSATVQISGAGDVSVAASESLNASISGSGDVRYAGSPKQVVKHITGSGSVARL